MCVGNVLPGGQISNWFHIGDACVLCNGIFPPSTRLWKLLNGEARAWASRAFAAVVHMYCDGIVVRNYWSCACVCVCCWFYFPGKWCVSPRVLSQWFMKNSVWGRQVWLRHTVKVVFNARHTHNNAHIFMCPCLPKSACTSNIMGESPPRTTLL